MSSMIQKRFLEPVAVGIEMVLPERQKGSALKSNQQNPQTTSKLQFAQQQKVQCAAFLSQKGFTAE